MSTPVRPVDAPAATQLDRPRSGSPSGGPLRRVLAGPAAFAAVGAAGLTVLGVIDPNQPGHYPTCPFLMLTGLYCPGCGSLRALHDLTHLDLAGAWGMNPLLVVVLPVLALLWGLWFRRAVRGVPKARLSPGWVPGAFLVVVVVYGVARNIPALAPWLAP